MTHVYTSIYFILYVYAVKYNSSQRERQYPFPLRARNTQAKTENTPVNIT